MEIGWNAFHLMSDNWKIRRRQRCQEYSIRTGTHSRKSGPAGYTVKSAEWAERSYHGGWNYLGAIYFGKMPLQGYRKPFFWNLMLPGRYFCGDLGAMRPGKSAMQAAARPIWKNLSLPSFSARTVSFFRQPLLSLPPTKIVNSTSFCGQDAQLASADIFIIICKRCLKLILES